jgi:hypothetical protein
MPRRLGIFDMPNIATQIATGQPLTGRDVPGQDVCGRAEKIDEMGPNEIGAH